MSNLALLLVGAVGNFSAIFSNYAKLRTSPESWFEVECIHVWAIGHIAHESRLKIQCPQEIGKKATAAYFSDAVYSPTYTVVVESPLDLCKTSTATEKNTGRTKTQYVGTKEFST